MRLLAHNMQSFKKFTHLVIDEVHERSADGDILCLLAKKVTHSPILFCPSLFFLFFLFFLSFFFIFTYLFLISEIRNEVKLVDTILLHSKSPSLLPACSPTHSFSFSSLLFLSFTST